MNLFATLEKKQRLTDFNAGSQNRFFLSQSSILNASPTYRSLAKAQKPFDIIRANIVLKAMANKRKLDEVYLTSSRIYRHNGVLPEEGKVAIIKAIDEAKKDLPYLDFGEDRIYVPILPGSLHAIYDKEITRFEEKPLRRFLSDEYEAVAVDPFDTYGWRLFDSYFTNLILVRQVGDTAAFFDYDSLSIDFVNIQGRVDVNLCLFDRALGKRNTNHMMERILPVVDAYFRDDREALMSILVQNQLISSSLIYKISNDEKRRFAKIERSIEK